MKYVLCILFPIFFAYAQPSHAKSFADYKWEYLYTHDADTLIFSAPWVPDPLPKRISVRLYGLDSAESGHLSKCKRENLLAYKATEFVREKVEKAKEIRVRLIAWDKYAGRVLGTVYLDDVSLNEMLIKGGYARPYDGGKKTSWCSVD